MRPHVMMESQADGTHRKIWQQEVPKQAGITTRYTDRAIEFMTQNKDRPFFLYLAHAMPHTELWPHPKFAGKNKTGLYADCIEEIDAGVGRVLDTLKQQKIDERTLVIFTSDNGPWVEARHNRRGARYQEVRPRHCAEPR